MKLVDYLSYDPNFIAQLDVHELNELRNNITIAKRLRDLHSDLEYDDKNQFDKYCRTVEYYHALKV